MRVTVVKVEPGTPGVGSRTIARLVCTALAIALLPACSWMPFRHGSREGKVNDCNKPQVYGQAASSPALRIPVGLDALNTRGALRIPELNEPEAPRTLTDSCLDEPPKYSTARLLPPPRDKKAEKQQQADEKRKRAEEKAAAKSPPAPAPTPAPASPPATP